MERILIMADERRFFCFLSLFFFFLFERLGLRSRLEGRTSLEGKWSNRKSQPRCHKRTRRFLYRQYKKYISIHTSLATLTSTSLGTVPMLWDDNVIMLIWREIIEIGNFRICAEKGRNIHLCVCERLCLCVCWGRWGIDSDDADNDVYTFPYQH